MAFRGKEMMKKALKKVGQNGLAPGLEKSLQNSLPDSKVVMGRAKRGLYAGRHIQFGNRVSEDGGNKSRRTWKPNVQKKRLFSYILDRHIQVKVTTHALRCIDKAGGIDEYLLKTPYQKMDTEMGLFWKAKIEKLYEELGNVQTTEGEASPEQGFKDLTLAEQDDHRQFGRHIFSRFGKQKQTEGESQEAGDENASSRVPVSYVICAHELKEKSVIANY
uniref:Large ribosomal subunit protein bL28m n=2 Tax=Rhizophora mucronata TaxID=61149 RepID=A0A2P2KBM1_RHIMU